MVLVGLHAEVHQSRAELVFAAELNQLFLVELAAPAEAQVDDDLLEVLSWVLRGGLGVRVLHFGEIFHEDAVVVLQNVEIQYGFLNWSIAKHAR